jgi:hypothetical protein
MLWAGVATLVGMVHATAAPYVLAVGVNQPAGKPVAALKYADDDAANAAALFDEPGRRWLLTVMDADTQELFPQLASEARPPTMDELTRSVQQIRLRVEEDLAAGERPTVLVWLVGHGVTEAGQEPYFAMLDGGLTPQLLEQRVLQPLAGAHRVHVVVDACHAAALVRARALSAPAETEEVERAFAGRAGVFPNAGFLLATSSGNQTFEWERIRSGVFSALVRSALRGAADVDGDRRVTYAETLAFVTSAVQSVPNPDVRPHVDARPPPVDRNAPLSHEEWFSSSLPFEPAPSRQAFHIEDGQGRWLMAARFEPSYSPRLWLPRNRGSLVHRDDAGERALHEENGRLVAQGPVQAPATQGRGGMDEALQRGMFGTPFGPSYFLGFVASSPVQPQPATPRVTPPPKAAPRPAVATEKPRVISAGGRRWGLALAAVPVGLLSAISLALGTVLLGVGMEGGYRFASEDRERPAVLALLRLTGGGGGGVVALMGAGGLLAAAVTVAAWALWPR